MGRNSTQRRERDPMKAKQDSEMRDVLITIKSQQSLSGDEDALEFITQGKYAVDEEGAHFFYQESELTGMQGTVTDFLVRPGQVVMSRKGTVTAQMIFQKGKKHHFAYETPYGMLTMGLDTHRLEHALGENGGEMEIEYDLDLDHAVVSRNRFKIHVRDMKGN